MKKTWEGGNCYEFSLDHHLEFFSKAGSLFEGRWSFYGNEESALSLFQKMWALNSLEDRLLSMKLLFWLRDCRGGAGNRSGFRSCAKWLAVNDARWMEANLELVPEHGRWDDLKVFFGTPLEEAAARLWARAIADGNVLAAKWAKREYKPLQRALGVNEAGLRKLLSSLRKEHIVEHKMCQNLWHEIDYSKVPSVALGRYSRAFIRHDEERFNEYLNSVKRGEAKINTQALFPHDCVATVMNGHDELGDLQFENLPNYMPENYKVIVVADTSGSMSIPISGSIQAVHVSIGLALYCSAKIPEDNPFHKKFIAFESESEFKNWNGMKFSEAVKNKEIFDGACGGTRIDKALKLILDTALFYNLKQEQLPEVLLIVSDMQFHMGVEGDGTEVEKVLREFEKKGYTPPKIVYWNTAGYAGSPATVNTPNTVLISGFSPAVLKYVFSTDFSPRSVMLAAVEKYDVKPPTGF
ncbi:DUF2828 family protein [Fervidobacterium thailandense]|uniref:DUF2828 family protein n=1 Tax=Fervidobacterium thailandense TaxID=1008305 RepID=A0A1E3G0R8_9BACT|nr:DUF2828 family protein [Fervidobacterium thailandense]ODN29844.1 hypothetical protein A4H02_08525 [Fervidobacterium thailandense]